jgi:hypothetical protein
MDLDVGAGGCTAKHKNVGSSKSTQKRTKADIRLEDTLFM